jgi:hypothetical protein
MRTTRRSLLTMLGASAFAGSALANPAGPSPGGADRGGGTFDSENSLDRIPLILADGYRFTALYLMLCTATQLFVFTTLNAVVQRYENRLPVARLPFLNQIIRADYRREDFELARKVAIYYLLGQTLLIDLRLRSMMEPVANLSTDWDQLENKLAADAQRPVNGEIAIEAQSADLAGPVSTVTVFNRDSSYSMLLGGRAVSEEARAAALPFLSNLPLTGRMFRSGDVTRKERELLVMVSPSIVERSWN